MNVKMSRLTIAILCLTFFFVTVYSASGYEIIRDKRSPQNPWENEDRYRVLSEEPLNFRDQSYFDRQEQGISSYSGRQNNRGRGPPSNREPPNNRGPPPNRGPPDNRGPPANRGPPPNRGPPNNRGPPDRAPDRNDLGNYDNNKPMNNFQQPTNAQPPYNDGNGNNLKPPVQTSNDSQNSYTPISGVAPDMMFQAIAVTPEE